MINLEKRCHPLPLPSVLRRPAPAPYFNPLFKIFQALSSFFQTMGPELSFVEHQSRLSLSCVFLFIDLNELCPI